MKIAEFEKITGLPRDTIRYYEKVGLLSPPLRGENGYRNYGQKQLKELAFIEQGKAIGFTLSTIKQGYQRYQELGYLCPDFKKQLEEKKARYINRIESDRLAITQIDKLLKR